MDFAQKLRQWYDTHKRELPWRNTSDPYKIWLSEVILQQTRVAQGWKYYETFIDRYPTVFDLATASEDDILKIWQGLGYYSRARNLHQAARTIVSEYNGEFPDHYKALLPLKGVGEYTAAAIASIAFGEPVAVVDGNVQRVLARVFGIDRPIDATEGKKRFREKAEEVLDQKDPGTHNQAVMEFGAIHCTPKAPDCQSCIFSEECNALSTGNVLNLPVKAKKIRPRNRYFNYLYIISGENTFLRKRTGKDIWQNLYEFPLLETLHRASWEELKSHDHFPLPAQQKGWELKEVSKEMKHVLTHQRIHAVFWTVSAKKDIKLPNDHIKVRHQDIGEYAFPRLMENYLKKMAKHFPDDQSLF